MSIGQNDSSPKIDTKINIKHSIRSILPSEHQTANFMLPSHFPLVGKTAAESGYFLRLLKPEFTRALKLQLFTIFCCTHEFPMATR